MSELPSESVARDRHAVPRLRVLAVDDEPAALDLYRQCLGRLRKSGDNGRSRHKHFSPEAHFEITTCCQAEDAVEAVRRSIEEQQPYALAFLDVHLPPGPDGIWTAARIRALDPEINIVVVTGFGDVYAERIARHVPPADKLFYIHKPFQPQEIIQFAVALGSKWQLENRFQQSYRELESRVEQRTAELERVNEALKRDIEERHRAEQALREGERRLRRQYRALMDLAHSKTIVGYDLTASLHELTEAAARTLDVDRVAIWLYEPDGATVRCHDRYERRTGQHAEGGLVSLSEYPDYFRALEDIRALAAHDARSDPRLRGFRGAYLAPQDVSARLDAPVRVGGRTVGVVCHEHIGASRHWNLDEQGFAGSIADFLSLVIEACERKRREDALRQLKRAVEQSIDGICITDIAGTVLFANRAWAEMHGYVSRDLAGSDSRIFHTPEQYEKEVKPLIKGVELTGSRHGEVGHVRRDGSVVPTWMTVTHLRDEADHPMGYLILARDIADQKRAEERGAQLEEQLRRAQKMEAIGRLAGGVAHDFNNMLMAIIGCSEFLLASLPADEPLRREVEEISKAGERAADLTRQLLAFSRRQVLQPKVIDLNNVVSDIEKMLRRIIGEDIELSTALDSHLGRIKADPGQIEQVIINLAINARDAMPGGGRLTIETCNVELDESYARDHAMVKPGPYVMLAVSDTGTGMDEETQAHIFEPFFTTKSQGKGTGLGLATVYGTVKQSGGYIWVYSEPGRGTTFKIYLPRVPGTVHRSVQPPVQAQALHGHETVLLVEDDPVVRNLVRRTLTYYGYTVLESAGAPEALAFCEQGTDPIHLMLTDVVMPQMNGRDLAEAVQGLRPETKILFMSGYSGEAVVQHGMIDHSTPFLQKPFTPDVLARKIRDLLDPSE